MTTRTLYQVLEVDPDASPDEIKAAFRRLAKATHPDHHPDDPTASDRFKEVAGAYDTLSDTALRLVYDAELRAAPEWSPPPQPDPTPSERPRPSPGQPWESVKPRPCQECRQRSALPMESRCVQCVSASEQRTAQRRAGADEALRFLEQEMQRLYAEQQAKSRELAFKNEHRRSYRTSQNDLERRYGWLGAWGRDGLPKGWR